MTVFFYLRSSLPSRAFFHIPLSQRSLLALKRKQAKMFYDSVSLAPPASSGQIGFSVSLYPSEVILRSKSGRRYYSRIFSPAKLSAMIFCSYSLPHFLQPTAGRFRSIHLPAAGVPVSFPKRRSPICGESANRALNFPKSKACLQRPAILYFSLSASRRRASSLENTQPQ